MTFFNNTQIKITTDNLVIVDATIVCRIEKMHNIRANSVNVFTKGEGRDMDVPHKFVGQVYNQKSGITKEFFNFCNDLRGN